jgi:hypothetical protein
MLDKNEINLLEKKIEEARAALKVPGMKISYYRHLKHRLNGLVFERDRTVELKMGVMI